MTKQELAEGKDARPGKDANELGIVLNFYCGTDDRQVRGLLVHTSALTVRLLVTNPVVSKVVVVDGSEHVTREMQEACDELGAEFVHGGRRLNYVESYNIGWQMLPHKYIGLIANDIIPHPPRTLELLLENVRKPDVGCTFPYMTTNRTWWDEVQRPGFLDRGRITCEPSTMTLNLNLFKRSVLEEIGGLDERYVAGFQEPILIFKIRSAGYRVVMVGNTRVFHYDALTKSEGGSHIDTPHYGEDAERFLGEYPKHSSNSGLACIRCSARPFSTTVLQAMFWWIAEKIPFARVRNRTIEFILWIEPLLCRYPTRWGKAKQPPRG